MKDQLCDRKSRRELKAAIRRFDKRGCYCCRKPPVVGGLEFSVRTRSGDVEVIHSTCLRDTDTVLNTGTYFEERDPYIEKDRIWFEDNPDASVRLRALSDRNELTLIDKSHQLLTLRNGLKFDPSTQQHLLQRYLKDPSNVCVIVAQLRSGARLRGVLQMRMEDIGPERLIELREELIARSVPMQAQAVIDSARGRDVTLEAQLLEILEFEATESNRIDLSPIEHARAEGQALTSGRN